ncbi:MAG: hypothetical protein GYA24_08910 [Candidatus Lokiarchaeota archaeon]|nr:hypothetical protein [Candidatus Lokiarchaeota archaeon]
MDERNKRLAGVLVASVLLGAGLGYGLGWLFPPRQSTTGMVVQSLSQVTSSQATKLDDEVTSTLVPGMSIDAHTVGNEYLVVEFSAMGILYLDSTFSGVLRFNVSLNLANVSRCNVQVYRFSSSMIGHIDESPFSLHMRWISPVLPGGTHAINVTWASFFNQPGLNSLTLSSSGVNMTRTLHVHVIRV